MFANLCLCFVWSVCELQDSAELSSNNEAFYFLHRTG